MRITSPAANLGAIGSACSLYIANSSCAETITNKYTAVFGVNANTLVGVGTPTPAYGLDINGILSVHRLYLAGTMMNNQLINLAEGTDQGSFGGGSAGTQKTMSLNTTAVYDLTQGGSKPLAGFAGGVFDGRYIYFVPFLISGSAYSGTVARYDTFLSFAAAGSYSSFDLTQLNSLAQGFWGGLFDGRYVYFIPSGRNANTLFVQYDTTRPFAAISSYTLFNLAAFVSGGGYSGGAFDGRYIYLVPVYADVVNVTTVRYDTTLSFAIATSYSIFDTSRLKASPRFWGAAFDGRYVYFVPFHGSSSWICQYDSTQPFSAPGSYTSFSPAAVSAFSDSFQGAIFDGRYVYFIPNIASAPWWLRYDTLQSFTTLGSYTAFNLLFIDPSNAGYQAGGVFDGRYIYFAHDEVNLPASTIIRFDTTEPFNSIGSYTCFSVGRQGPSKGAVYDGRYVYFVPADNSPTASGTIVRIDAYPGPQATAMAASRAPNGFVVGSYAGSVQPPPNGLLVSNTIGINNTNPQYNVDVGGSIHANAIIATNLTITPDATSGGIYATGGTTRQQLITLAEGYDQGGFGGGSVGTNKTLSLNSTALFNVAAGINNALALGGFAGAVFDGRYVYFVPYVNYGYQGTIVRYDTTLPFAMASGSFSTFDIAQVIGVANVGNGFYGGLYDGRYVYYIPMGVDTKPLFVRYDTTLMFGAVNSYTGFDLTTIGTGIAGYAGGVFDSRYIYLAPGAIDSDAPISTTIVRYDTTLSFTNGASYSTFNTRAIDSQSLTTYVGAVFDGRYVYFVPYITFISGRDDSGTATRYDTTLPFASPGSYTIFNLITVAASCKAFQGGLFDGRYVYYIPASGFTGGDIPLLTRYDTMQPFTSVSSYTTFNMLLIDPTNTGETIGGVFDGRYIYLGHAELPPSPGGTIVRFDTVQPFNSAASYTCVGVGSPLRFRGGVYDGHYVYFSPGSNSASRVFQATIVRLDAYPGAGANAIAASQAPNGFAVGTYAGVASFLPIA